MAIAKKDILEAVAGMTVMDLNDLVKAFEEKVRRFRRCRSVAAPGAGGGAAAAAEEKPSSGRSRRRRRQESRSHQGRSCRYRPGPQRKPRTWSTVLQARQGSDSEGRCRRPQEAARDAGAKVEIK